MGAELEIQDITGKKRKIRLTQNELILEPNGETLSSPLPALKIEKRNTTEAEEIWVHSIQQNDFLKIGDIKAQSVCLSSCLKVQAGDYQVSLGSATRQEFIYPSLNVPKGVTPWLTVSSLGVEMLLKLKKASQTSLSIYLEGETGTGKELLAQMIHAWSPQNGGTFVPINCGALALSLAESELFGHVKGAFTGAVKDRPGALLQAQGGTLFLDEVGDLSPDLQVKLLRFLESGEIRPVGSDRVLHAQVRVICATHKSLARLVKEGKFRQDLYFRLASIPVKVPSLKERIEDISFLANAFAQKSHKKFTSDALRFLRAYSWPGNVRELRHAVERAVGMAEGEEWIHKHDFSFLLEQAQEEEDQMSMTMQGVWSMHDLERFALVKALKATRGNRSEAARLLGVARSTLFEMIKRHQVSDLKSNDFWLNELQLKV